MSAPLPRWDDTSATYAWRHRQRLGRQFGEFWREVYRNWKRDKAEYLERQRLKREQRLRNSTLVPRAVDTADAMFVAEAGYEGDPLVTAKEKVLTCKSVTGRNRPLRFGSVIRDMLTEQTNLFQSVSNTVTTFYSWQVNGVNPLNCRYIEGKPGNAVDSWPRKANFPVYIYRLSCCNGMIAGHASGTAEFGYPLIQYRLQGSQTADGEAWTYTWEPVDPSNNSDSTYPTVNKAPIVVQDGQIQKGKVYHESTVAKILVTAPTLQPVSLGIDIIQFNDDDSAPPDQYYASASGGTAKKIDFGTPGVHDKAVNNEYYSTWLFNRLTHPCVTAYKPPDMNKSAPFRILKRHRMTLGPRDTTNANTAGPQYLHTEVLREHRWHATANVHFVQNSEGPDVDPDGTADQKAVEMFDTVGIFPDCTKQKWLMVTSFGSAPQVSTGNPFTALAEASFDISIRSKFKASSVFGLA